MALEQPRRGHRPHPRRGRPRRGPRRPHDAASTSPRSRPARSSTCACSASPSSRPGRSRPSTTSSRSASPSCARSSATRRRVYALIREELLEIRGRYADERRTEIVPGEGDIDLEDLIAEEEMVISISNGGYVKRLPVSTYRAQGRGGKGLRGVRLKDDDYIEHLFIASTHHYLLFFTNTGKVYRQKVHELPQGSRDSRGRHLANVLALQRGRGGAGGLRDPRLHRGPVPGARDPRRDGQEDRDAQLRHDPARGAA